MNKTEKLFFFFNYKLNTDRTDYIYKRINWFLYFFSYKALSMEMLGLIWIMWMLEKGNRLNWRKKGNIRRILTSMIIRKILFYLIDFILSILDSFGLIFDNYKISFIIYERYIIQRMYSILNLIYFNMINQLNRI